MIYLVPLKDLNVTEVDLAGLDIGVIGKQTLSLLHNLQKLDLSDNTVLSLRFHNFAPSLRYIHTVLDVK